MNMEIICFIIHAIAYNLQGETFKQTLVDHYASYMPHQQCMDYYATPDGRAFCQKYIDYCYKRFPHYMDELRGLSEATGIPLEKVSSVYLYNMNYYFLYLNPILMT